VLGLEPLAELQPLASAATTAKNATAARDLRLMCPAMVMR